MGGAVKTQAKVLFIGSSHTRQSFDVALLEEQLRVPVSLVAYKLVDLVIGLRVPEEEEREGLDTTSHGESAYVR